MGTVCLPLFDEPTTIGLQPDVLNDVVERPTGDGRSVVIVAAIPFADYGVEPFATSFDDLVASISFDEERASPADE